jgi:hypothetical protein
MSIDDIMFSNEPVKRKESGGIMVKKKVQDKATGIDKAKYGIGLDVGTGFLVGSSYINDNQVKFTMMRDCFFTVDKDNFSKSMFNKNQLKWIEIDSNVHIVGEDSLVLAKIQNCSAKRPLAKGVINPNERSAAPILREMLSFCVKNYKKKENETLVFSVPGALLGNGDFNVEYHSLSIQSLLKSLGYNAVPLNEAYAVIIAELDKSNNTTGLGFSFGAGLVNVAFVYKGMLLFEFSINKSGDFIDTEAAKACGASESMMNHIKETQLDLSGDEFSVGPEERALIFTYKHVIRNTITNMVNMFNSKDNVNIIEPIPIVISGGTSLPKGFIEIFTEELNSTKLPFEVTEIIPAKDRLSSVAKGCLMWSNQLEEQLEEQA